MPLAPRTSNDVPRDCSRSEMRLLTAEATVCVRSAARAILPASAVATNTSRSRRSNFIPSLFAMSQADASHRGDVSLKQESLVRAPGSPRKNRNKYTGGLGSHGFSDAAIVATDLFPESENSHANTAKDARR